MPQTITSYFTFAPKTPARSSEVNNNFSNYRGTILPLAADTQTSTDNESDLGKNLKRWRTGYFATSINIRDLTTTSTFSIEGRGETQSGYLMNVDDTVAAALVGGPDMVQTYSASYGHMVVGEVLGDSFGGAVSGAGITATALARTTLSMATTGRPVIYSFIGYAPPGAVASFSSQTDLTPGIVFSGAQSATQTGRVFLVRNGVTLTSVITHYLDANMTSGNPGGGYLTILSPTACQLIDLNPGQTTTTEYYLCYRGFSIYDSAGIQNAIPYIKEI